MLSNCKHFFMLVFISFLLCSATATATAEIKLSEGQTLYVPVYSSILLGGRNNSLQLSAMLSICNTDLHHKIVVLSLEFFDHNGILVKQYLKEPLLLNPLASHHLFLSENENKAGIGANFIVRWRSVKPVNTPLVECVMIGTKSGQGISFTSTGKEIATDNR